MSSEPKAAPAPLDARHRRVLGSLIEKQLSASAYYPMTLAALVAACNQKSNRDPEMSLDEDTVWLVLEALAQRGLVTRLMPGGSARTDRFRHEVDTAFGWAKPLKAVMAELLLRGPQTPGELRMRCERMFVFENVDAVSATLDVLATGPHPWVRPLPRSAGQSAVRFAHTLYPPNEAPTVDARAEARDTPTAQATPQPPTPGLIDQMHARLTQLEQRVAELERRLPLG